MSKMDPCPQCGGKLKATLAPLWGWECPKCLTLLLPKDISELNLEELRALFPHFQEVDNRLEETLVRAEKAEARIIELENQIQKLQPVPRQLSDLSDEELQAKIDTPDDDEKTAMQIVELIEGRSGVQLGPSWRNQILAIITERRAEDRERIDDLEAIDMATAKQLTEHAEAAGVDPDHIDYIDETTRAIIALWAANSELKAKVEKVTTENTYLRAALATSKDPCIYCQLPAEEMAKCERGFPGCARADDLSGCPEFGAAMEVHDLREALQKQVDYGAQALAKVADLRYALRRVWHATGPKELEALVEPLLEEEP